MALPDVILTVKDSAKLEMMSIQEIKEKEIKEFWEVVYGFLCRFIVIDSTEDGLVARRCDLENDRRTFENHVAVFIGRTQPSATTSAG